MGRNEQKKVYEYLCFEEYFRQAFNGDFQLPLFTTTLNTLQDPGDTTYQSEPYEQEVVEEPAIEPPPVNHAVNLKKKLSERHLSYMIGADT